MKYEVPLLLRVSLHSTIKRQYQEMSTMPYVLPSLQRFFRQQPKKRWCPLPYSEARFWVHRERSAKYGIKIGRSVSVYGLYDQPCGGSMINSGKTASDLEGISNNSWCDVL